MDDNMKEQLKLAKEILADQCAGEAVVQLGKGFRLAELVVEKFGKQEDRCLTPDFTPETKVDHVDLALSTLKNFLNGEYFAQGTFENEGHAFYETLCEVSSFLTNHTVANVENKDLLYRVLTETDYLSLSPDQVARIERAAELLKAGT